MGLASDESIISVVSATTPRFLAVKPRSSGLFSCNMQTPGIISQSKETDRLYPC